MLAMLLAIYILILISALLYIAANMYTKRDHQRRIAAREKYQDHIGNLVDELVQQLFSADTIQAPTVQQVESQEATVQYQ